MKSNPSYNAFRHRVLEWGTRLRVTPTEVRVQRMTRKWASCSSAGRVMFATDLLDESPAFRDFVIVHELLHLRVPNHGKLFKALMSHYVPGWRRYEPQRRQTKTVRARRKAA